MFIGLAPNCTERIAICFICNKTKPITDISYKGGTVYDLLSQTDTGDLDLVQLEFIVCYKHYLEARWPLNSAERTSPSILLELSKLANNRDEEETLLLRKADLS